MTLKDWVPFDIIFANLSFAVHDDLHDTDQYTQPPRPCSSPHSVLHRTTVKFFQFRLPDAGHTET